MLKPHTYILHPPSVSFNNFNKIKRPGRNLNPCPGLSATSAEKILPSLLFVVRQKVRTLRRMKKGEEAQEMRSISRAIHGTLFFRQRFLPSGKKGCDRPG